MQTESKNGAWRLLIIAALAALASCVQPNDTDKPNPKAETRSVTLTISRADLSLMSQSITFTEGEAYTRNLDWLESCQDNLDGLTAEISGDKNAFTDPKKETSLNISIEAQPSVDISQADLNKLTYLLDTIKSELSNINISFSHNGTGITPVEYEQASVSLTISVGGAGSQPPAIGITLRNSNTAEASFTWLTDYQNYTIPSHERTYGATVSGDSIGPFTGNHHPKLKFVFKAPDGTHVELSAIDEAALKAAVQAAFDVHFNEGNKPAANIVRGTGIINPKKNGGLNYQNDLSLDPALTISLGGVTGELKPGTKNVVIINYVDPTNIAGFTIPNGEFKTAIAGKDITVDIQGSGTISLAYVHYLRQALQSANSVSIDSSLIPEFDGRDWWTHGSTSLAKDLYSTYPENTETVLMNGVKVSHDSIDNKYVIVYERDLKVSRPVWQNNNDGVEVPFHGFGLEKDKNGSIAPFNNGRSIVFGGNWREENNNDYYSRVSDWVAYESALKEAGLHPSQKDTSGNPIRLDHSRVQVNGITGPTNVVSNGLYDFILAYYNPAPTGTPDDGLKALLPDWKISGLSFDGYAKDSSGYIKNAGKYTPVLPESGTSRNIGGIIAASGERKASSAGVYGSVGSGYNGQAYEKNEPRVDFVSSITYAMAKYLAEKLNIHKISNTNIIGNYLWWVGDKFYTNVAFIGDYSSLDGIPMKTHGVIDIKGPLPKQIIDNAAEAKYLNIWSNISRETNIFDFPIAVLRGSGGENITTGSYLTPGSEAKVIIYHNKYTGTPPKNSDAQPHYRAFMVGATPKITGGSIPSDNTPAYKYQGNQPTKPIPGLDEDEVMIKARAVAGIL